MDQTEKQMQDEEAEVMRIAEENKKKAQEENIPLRDEILRGELDKIASSASFRTMLGALSPSMVKNYESEPEIKKPAQAARPIIAKREMRGAYDPAEAMRIYNEKKAKNKEAQ